MFSQRPKTLVSIIKQQHKQTEK